MTNEGDDDETPPQGIRLRSRADRRAADVRLAVASANARLFKAAESIIALAGVIKACPADLADDWIIRVEGRLADVGDSIHQARRDLAEARRRRLEP